MSLVLFSFSVYAGENHETQSKSESAKVEKTKTISQVKFDSADDFTFCNVTENYIGILGITMYCVRCASTQAEADIQSADCGMDMQMLEMEIECSLIGC